MTQHRQDGLWGRAGSPGHVRGEGEGSNVSTERLVGALTFPPASGAAHHVLGVLASPGIVKRNTLLLAASQAFVGMGNQMVPPFVLVLTRMNNTNARSSPSEEP